jgi:uncharacterized membrane protein YjgN (DUF898 family)
MDTINLHQEAAPARELNRFQFDGKGGELFLLMLVNYVLTIFTVGIYSFWGRTRTRKYIWSHLTFSGDRLEYTGTGKELFISFLKVFAVFFSVAIVVGLVGKIGAIFQMVATLIFYVVIFLVIGYAQYSARNYRLARTRWRGIRMGMTNARKEYMKAYVVTTLLTIVTLGFYAPVRWIKLRSILVGNTRIGNMKLTYTGDASQIYGKYIGNIILTIITFGIFSFWHQAWKSRYDYNNTHLGETQFKSILQGGDLFFTTIATILMVALSFGLATPWALRLWIETHTDSLAILGRLPLEQIAQGAGPEASAIGEEVAEFLDVDFGF